LSASGASMIKPPPAPPLLSPPRPGPRLPRG
jgi:hypothetical protein